MKNSVITLMPIPDGFIVLTKVTTSSGVTWATPEECGYSFRLADFDDGTTALYRVYPDGSIDIDRESILVEDLYCMHCGERLNPDMNAVTRRPVPFHYYCSGCGQAYKIEREDVCL